MTQAETLFLELDDGRPVPLQIRRRARDRSLHTGRELVELHGWATAAEESAHRVLSAQLRELGDRAIGAVDGAGEPAGRWCVSWNSYAESNGLHTYTLVLREAEELSLEALVLNGLELHPYEYRERVVGDGLAVWAKMVGTEADVQQLRAALNAAGTVSVVRRGIQDAPRPMRLGVAEWSEWEDRIKYRLVLVDHGVDAGEHPELARIERANNRAALSFYMNFAEQLVALLLRRGVATPEEIDAAREAAAGAPGLVRHDLWHVPSIDDR